MPENAHLFVASGAAMAHESSKLVRLGGLVEAIDGLGDTQGAEVVEAIDGLGDTQGAEVARLEPLFATNEDLVEFRTRHAKEVVPRGELEGYTGRVFIGLVACSSAWTPVPPR